MNSLRTQKDAEIIKQRIELANEYLPDDLTRYDGAEDIKDRLQSALGWLPEDKLMEVVKAIKKLLNEWESES